MGIEVQITNVNKEASSVSYTKEGVPATANVVAPAQIKWAKVGKAEVGFKEGAINFIKSLEPRAESTTNNYSNFQKKERTHNAVSTMEILENVTLKEIKAVYDSQNAEDSKKCGASTLFKREDGKYDAALYVTTFVKIVVAPQVNTAELMEGTAEM